MDDKSDLSDLETGLEVTSLDISKPCLLEPNIKSAPYSRPPKQQEFSQADLFLLGVNADIRKEKFDGGDGEYDGSSIDEREFKIIMNEQMNRNSKPNYKNGRF